MDQWALVDEIASLEEEAMTASEGKLQNIDSQLARFRLELHLRWGYREVVWPDQQEGE